MSLTLSPTHGVNPAVPVCYLCQDDKNEVLLTGRLPEDAEAPQHAVWDMAPCDNCKALMKQGLIVISIKDGQSDELALARQDHEAAQSLKPPAQRGPFLPNPYRTGGWWVVREEAISRALKTIVKAEVVDQLMRVGYVFLDDQVCRHVGLDPSNPDVHTGGGDAGPDPEGAGGVSGGDGPAGEDAGEAS